jgi:hypothetical protein
MRVALPLLVIGLLRTSNFWERVPLLWRIPQPVLLGILVSWSLCELVLAKSLLGQRVQQIIQLTFSPLAGAILGVTVAWHVGLQEWVTIVVGAIGSLLALVIQLVQVGWFFRLRGLPWWVSLAQDALCICLVLFAFDAPRQGGLIALLLLWLALRSSSQWRQWYKGQGPTLNSASLANARQGKLEPD